MKSKGLSALLQQPPRLCERLNAGAIAPLSNEVECRVANACPACAHAVQPRRVEGMGIVS